MDERVILLANQGVWVHGGDDVEAQARLVESFKALRRNEGVTAKKLSNHSFLLEMLDATSPEDALESLSTLAQTMGNGPAAKAVRNALALGDDAEPHLKLDDRRNALAERYRIQIGSRSKHYRFEESDAGFKELARLVLNRQFTPLVYSREYSDTSMHVWLPVQVAEDSAKVSTCREIILYDARFALGLLFFQEEDAYERAARQNERVDRFMSRVLRVLAILLVMVAINYALKESDLHLHTHFLNEK